MLQIDRVLIKLATGTFLFGGLINEEELTNMWHSSIILFTL
jgi:hypothetical protein